MNRKIAPPWVFISIPMIVSCDVMSRTSIGAALYFAWMWAAIGWFLWFTSEESATAIK